jgi:predicted DNA binding CopG/RHH family protein
MDSLKTKPVVKDTKWYFENQVLDDEELQITKDMKSGLYKPTRKLAERKAEHKSAAENTLKKTPITVRVQAMDIARLKLIASKQGIPYQTLVSSVLHRYATGILKGDA